MRFFRIPSFTGIEAHRDDADRGSLRMVEGCLPHGPGGLRSGPVWKKIGDVQSYSQAESNYVTASDDGQGNSLLFVSRNCKVHDLAVISEENTEISNFGETYNVAIPEVSLYNTGPANLTPIGNKLYAVGDGSQESMFVGKGPDDTFEVFPDENLYSQEWSRFPKCQYFVQGPKKTIFAAGNPDKPLTVYISEPAGLTSPYRDTPYSTEDTTYNQGILSTVDILGSNASKITALSTRGDQVVVHTDKGCHLLYAPAPDQASTGYRVEQAPATNFSAAVSSRVVSRASGALTYWVGHDGQVYKDEAASRGSEDLRSRADEDQANWKSKGVWEHEHPTDLSNSFAAYSPQSGDYIFFLESNDIDSYEVPNTPTDFTAEKNPIIKWKCTTKWCEAQQSEITCCGPSWPGMSSYDGTGYLSPEECVANSPCDNVCCGPLGIADCCYCPGGPWVVDPDCGCYDSGNICNALGFATLEQCQAHAEDLPRCNRYAKDTSSCICYQDSDGEFESLEACEAHRDADPNCGSSYSISGDDGCVCIEDPNGSFSDRYECIEATNLNSSCRQHSINEDTCECEERVEGNGDYENLALCQVALSNHETCGKYQVVDCACVQTETGGLTYAECQDSIPTDCYNKYSTPCCGGGSLYGFNTYEECAASSGYLGGVTQWYCSTEGGVSSYQPCFGGVYQDHPDDWLSNCSSSEDCDCPEKYWDKDENTCSCTSEVRQEQGTGFTSEELCLAALADVEACASYDIVNCACVKSLTNDGEFSSSEECDTELNIRCPKHSIVDCLCVEDANGSYQGLVNCQTALNINPDCAPHWLVDCNCTASDPGDGSASFPDLAACIEELEQKVECDCDSSDRRYNTFVDDGDTFCLDAGSGSGQFTECECMQLGYTII